jgi:hypothetical protein
LRWRGNATAAGRGESKLRGDPHHDLGLPVGYCNVWRLHRVARGRFDYSAVLLDGLGGASRAVKNNCSLNSALTASTAFAAQDMAPSDIKATFFNGQAFTASTPGGTQFKMTFTPDGKMIREPVAQSGYKSNGAWKLDAKGFCTIWQNAQRTCFTVIPNGENKWSVQKGANVVATMDQIKSALHRCDRRFHTPAESTMTVDESKALKKGTRVYWRGDAADSGVITETSCDAVTITWNNGQVARVRHGDMREIQLTPTEPRAV